MTVRTRRSETVGNNDVFEIRVTPPKKVVSVKIDVDLLHEIDKVWRELGYKSRSQFIIEAIIYYMQVVKSMKGRVKAPTIDMELMEEINNALEFISDDEFEGYDNID